MTTLGDISLKLLLDTEGFSKGIKSAIQMLEVLAKSGKELGVFNEITTDKSIQELEKLEQANKDLQSSLQKTQPEANKTAKEIDQIGKSASTASPYTVRLASTIQDMGLRLQGVQAVLTVFKNTVGDLVMTAARTQTLGVAVEVIGKNAGFTKQQIDDAVTSVEKMGITLAQSRDAVISFAQANFDLADASKLARVSQDAAALAGENSSDTFNSILHGITTLNPLILRNSKIIVDLDKAYSQLAISLGKKTDELSTAEKQQAALNAVMEFGKTISGSYELTMGTVGKQIGSLPRHIESLKVSLGELLLPVVSDMVSLFTDTIKLLDGLPDPLKRVTLSLYAVGVAVVFLNGRMKPAYITMGLLLSASQALPEPLRKVAVALVLLSFAVDKLNLSKTTLLTKITLLKTQGVKWVGSFASGVATKLGPGSVAALAVFYLIGLFEVLLDVIKNVAFWSNRVSNQTTIQTTSTDQNTNTPSVSTSVALKTDKDGVLIVKTKDEAKELGIYPNDGVYGPEITPEQREAIKQQLELEKLKKDNKGGSTGKGGSPHQEAVVLNALQEQLKTLKEIDNELQLNAGFQGTINDLTERRLQLLRDMYYTITGIKIAEEISLNEYIKVSTGQLPEQLTGITNVSQLLSGVKIKTQSLEAADKIGEHATNKALELAKLHGELDREITEKKIELVKDEFDRRRAEIEETYNLELQRIHGITDATEEQRRTLFDLAKQKRGRELEMLDDERFIAQFERAESIANNIQGIFNFGAHTVYAHFLKALQITQQIIALFQTLESLGALKWLGSLLGSIFGFAIGGPAGAVAGAGVGGGIAGMPAPLGPGVGGGSTLERNPVSAARFISNQSQMIRLDVDVHGKVTGNDLKLIQRRVDRIESRREK